jgi:class I lanthipeptide synthase
MDSKTRYQPLTHFVIRTPVLPFDVLAGWASQPDLESRRDVLRKLVDDPTVREALYVASPELDAQIAAWQREPDSAANIGVERALVRYISRMASRATPFGLFAAVSVGAVGGETTRLDPSPRSAAQRHTRLDNDFLFALCADLAKDPEARTQLRYRPNQSLYTAAGRLRYAEARLAGPARTYHLVAVDRNDYLEALFARARDSASLDELTEVLTADPEISREEAIAFIHECIDAQLLVAELAPSVTGPEPTEHIVDVLEAQGLGKYARPLRAARDGLKIIDEAAPGLTPNAYKGIEKVLAVGLPTKVEPSRLFQVDLFKPAESTTLGDAVTAELARGFELLRKLTPPGGDATWVRFREKFTARYETREVPLVEVLDEEVGIGFGGDTSGAGNAPLLTDLGFPMRSEPRRVPVGARDMALLGMVTNAVRTGATEIELSDEDVEQLSYKNPPKLPEVVTVGAVLMAESQEAIAEGKFQLRMQHAGAGANLLGRFCHGSDEVHELTKQALRAEEAARPDAVYAEIVHLPDGRVGNVLLRPVLRDYEIAYLGHSGADEDKRISVSDLMVSVEGDRVVLRSKRLGKEVIPRMTTAHNYSARSLTLYRFLCSHANQVSTSAYWHWGSLEDFPFLPRLRHGKIILSRARWIVSAKDLAPLETAFAGINAAKTPCQVRAKRLEVVAAMTALRTKLGLPRWIVIGDGDNELPVDLDNELMVDSAAHLLKSRNGATLYELLPAHDQLCARGVEGSFAHELQVLFARAAEPVARPSQSTIGTAESARRFMPGSPWLYLKLYTGTATADALLRELAPAIDQAIANGLADSWFFIRYSDPDWHVRLRFTGDPQKLTSELLPYLYRALAPLGDRGLLWRLQVDTYEREVERYGGPDGIEIAEQLFHADSEATLAVIAACEGDAGAEAAWRLSLRGIDQLMDDLGMSLAEKLAAMTSARDSFGAEFGMNTAFQKQLGDKFRKHGKEIAALLAASADDREHVFAPALEAFAARSERLRPLGAQLRALQASGQLTQTIDELVASYIHMHVNRMIRSSARAHEVVLYDLLRRHYDGVVARSRHSQSKLKNVQAA